MSNFFDFKKYKIVYMQRSRLLQKMKISGDNFTLVMVANL